MNHGSCIFLLLVCTNHFKCNRIKLSLSVYWEWFKNTNIMLLVDTVTVVSNMSLYYVCSLFQRGVVFYTLCFLIVSFVVMEIIYLKLGYSLSWVPYISDCAILCYGDYPVASCVWPFYGLCFCRVPQVRSK